MLAQRSDRLAQLVEDLFVGHGLGSWFRGVMVTAVRPGDVELVEQTHDLVVEVGDRPWCERQRPFVAGGCDDVEAMVDEIEVDLEGGAGRVRHRQAGEPAGA